MQESMTGKTQASNEQVPMWGDVFYPLRRLHAVMVLQPAQHSNSAGRATLPLQLNRLRDLQLDSRFTRWLS